MHRTAAVFIIAVAALLLAGVAIAASPHFKKGGEPICTVTRTAANVISTTCKASMAGLGNADLNIQTIVSGSAVYQCRNAGGNIAPGQNKVSSAR